MPNLIQISQQIISKKKSNTGAKLLFLYVCIVLLSVRPTKRGWNQKKIFNRIQREQTKSAGRYSPHHIFINLLSKSLYYNSWYDNSVYCTHIAFSPLYMRLNSTKNFCRFRSQTFSWVQWSEVSIGDGICISYLWIYIYIHINCVYTIHRWKETWNVE